MAVVAAVTAVGVAGAPAPSAASPAPPSTDTYVRWILTYVAGIQPTDDDIAAYSELLDAGVPRVALTTFAVHHDQPLGFMAQLAYNSTLNRQLDGVGARFWVARISSGQYSVGGAQVAIASSAEAFGANGGTPTSWVTAPYHLFLRRDPSSTEAAYWAKAATTAHGRAAVATAIHDSAEARRAFVRLIAESVLGRPMDAAGLTYWAGQLPRLGELGLAARLLASDEMVRRTATT